MTAAFVAVLSIYQFPDTNAWALPVALVLFIVAALTDALDGYLARKWQVVSVFGRIMDPFADKILILGAFVMLAGPGFWIPDTGSVVDSKWNGQISGVAPWMVIVILSRELLVTTIRAVFESRGVDFSAALSGKMKMIAQAVCVPVILLLVVSAGNARNGVIDFDIHRIDADKVDAVIAHGRDILAVNTVIAWGVVVITVWSALPYITRAISALRKPA